MHTSLFRQLRESKKQKGKVARSTRIPFAINTRAQAAQACEFMHRKGRKAVRKRVQGKKRLTKHREAVKGRQALRECRRARRGTASSPPTARNRSESNVDTAANHRPGGRHSFVTLPWCCHAVLMPVFSLKTNFVRAATRMLPESTYAVRRWQRQPTAANSGTSGTSRAEAAPE